MTIDRLAVRHTGAAVSRLLPRARHRRGALPGFAFQAVEPGERGYPPDQIELFCEAHLRAELAVDDGDLTAVWLNDG